MTGFVTEFDSSLREVSMGNTVQNGCSGRDTGSTCDGLVGRPDGDDVYVYSDPPPVFGQRVSGKSRSNARLTH